VNKIGIEIGIEIQIKIEIEMIEIKARNK